MKSLPRDTSVFPAGLCALLLAACAQTVPPAPVTASRSIVNGPSADYPMVLGDPFTIDGVTYTPEDTMNYDRVGYLAADAGDTPGITAAHRTLPLPSYVEVTSLDSGRTILVRVERRGPMVNDRLIALSPAALAQLGVAEGAPIRMRRVNPPEEHRAELRAGREAPLRMDTPEGLLDVLKRRLPERGSVELGDPQQAQVSGKVPTPDSIALIDPDEEVPSARDAVPGIPAEADSATAGREEADPSASTETMATVEAPEGSPVEAPDSGWPGIDAAGKFAIQLGAFSVRANADRLARKVGGHVETSGRYALVRVGPFASRGQADQALAKLRAQGYSDAQLRTLD